MREHLRHIASKITVKQRDNRETGKDGIGYPPRRLQQRRNEDESHHKVRRGRQTGPRNEIVKKEHEIQRTCDTERGKDKIIEGNAAGLGLFRRGRIEKKYQRQRKCQMDGALHLGQQQSKTRGIEVEAGHRDGKQSHQLSLPAGKRSEPRLRVVLAHKIFKIDLRVFLHLINDFYFCFTHQKFLLRGESETYKWLHGHDKYLHSRQ